MPQGCIEKPLSRRSAMVIRHGKGMVAICRSRGRNHIRDGALFRRGGSLRKAALRALVWKPDDKRLPDYFAKNLISKGRGDECLELEGEG